MVSEFLNAGHELTVVTARPSYRSATSSVPQDVGISAAKVLLVPRPPLSKNRTWLRILAEFVFTTLAGLRLLFLPGIQLVLLSTTPPFLIWLSHLAALRRIKSVLILHDIFPEIAVATGHIPSDGLLRRFWQALNRSAYRRASSIVVLGEGMRKRIWEYLPEARRDQVHVIENWSTHERMLKEELGCDLSFRREFGLERKFLVAFAGNLGRFQGLETILDAAEVDVNQETVYLLIGDGASRLHLEKEIEERQIGNLRILPFLTDKMYVQFLREIDVALVTLAEGVHDLCAPSKIYPLLQAGIPIVSASEPESDLAKIVERRGVGINVPNGKAEALADAVGYLRENPEIRRSMRECGWAVYWRGFSKRSACQRYLDIIDRL